jgi:hypothetical protein
MKAVVFLRDCGATTNFSTQVSIVSAKEDTSNATGNVLILDGKVPLSLQWQSDKSLQVRGALPAKIFKQQRLVSSIAVNYGP